MELSDVVRDGVECLAAVERLQPDVLLLDLEMPRMNGLEVLRRLAVSDPSLPVVMCSAYTEAGARATLEALACGAKDYVMKPGSQSDFAAALDLLMEQLLPRIAALSAARYAPAQESHTTEDRTAVPAARADRHERPDFGLRTVAAIHAMESAVPLVLPPPPQSFSRPVGVTRVEALAEGSTARVEVVVIGVSTGGPSALEQMLPMLARDFPVPILIVQHMPKLFTGALAERLDRCCSLRVMQGMEAGLVEPGTIWLAPGDAHMEVVLRETVDRRRPRRSVVRLSCGEPVHHCRPSVDTLFHSAARLYGAGTLAVIMTGMGSDGLDGCRAVSKARGQVVAQDEGSSAVWGMPGQVARAGLASAVVPLQALAVELTRRVAVGREGVVARCVAAADEEHARSGFDRSHREVSYGVL
jgi:two-component system chemotaxis response regulator CheB